MRDIEEFEAQNKEADFRSRLVKKEGKTNYIQYYIFTVRFENRWTNILRD